MRMPAVFKNAGLLFVLLWLAFFSIEAQAAIDNAGVLDNVLNRYSAAASGWAGFITARATWLFWTLAVISMVWTFGFMALRKADIGEFYAEFIRFTIFTGFFWWLLTNGPNFATDIMSSLRTIAGSASGTGSTLTPSGIVDIGFDIFFKVLDQSSVWSPVDSAAGILISAAILIILALIGVNMLLLLVSGWILAYAGVFFLGFGGSRWTSDMAINYYKTVLNIAAQLFTMVLLVGIGKSFVDQYYNAMSAGISLKELGVMMIVAVVLLALVNKLPSMVGGLAMGGGAHALGGGFGAGAAMGAAAVAGAAIATGGAAIAAGAASAAGGAQALMAAYSKASAASSEGGGGGGMGDTMGGVAMAAAGPGGGSSGGGSVFAGMDTGSSSGSGSGSGSSGSSGSGGGFGGGASEGGSSGGKSSAPAGEGKDSGGGAAPGAEGKADAGGKSAGSDAKGGGQGTGLAPGEQRSTGSMLGRAAAIAAGTAGNLAQGSWDVAKAKAASMRESALDRISETTGGKIAAAIRAQDAAAPADLSTPAPAPSSAAQASTAATAFNDNELSAGKGQAETPVAPEVADFMNRNSKTS
ncbi:P-type conjugative transfer protein TrbL [Xanthomonas hyacinthi]|jgi:type IV secretion system protein TrbL|nr:P-type conjugative transfer protein TrbL [Xanthomonas hyacinthi]KLD79850.1 conjugal transfer protein TrbL [Xanthomonas hyacinthi DSM 19077]